MKYQLFVLCLLLGGAVCDSQAQSRSRIGAADAASSQRKDEEETVQIGSAQQEFVHRSAIARLEAEHKKHAERAYECAALSIEMEKSFQTGQTFNQAFIKKLERLEKLTRRIRDYAGGSEDEEANGGLPTDAGASLIRLREVAERMQREVEITPRRVVSAKIINTTNELLTLVRRVRNFAKP